MDGPNPELLEAYGTDEVYLANLEKRAETIFSEPTAALSRGSWGRMLAPPSSQGRVDRFRAEADQMNMRFRSLESRLMANATENMGGPGTQRSRFTRMSMTQPYNVHPLMGAEMLRTASARPEILERMERLGTKVAARKEAQQPQQDMPWGLMVGAPSQAMELARAQGLDPGLTTTVGGTIGSMAGFRKGAPAGRGMEGAVQGALGGGLGAKGGATLGAIQGGLGGALLGGGGAALLGMDPLKGALLGGGLGAAGGGLAGGIKGGMSGYKYMTQGVEQPKVAQMGAYPSPYPSPYATGVMPPPPAMTTPPGMGPVPTGPVGPTIGSDFAESGRHLTRGAQHLGRGVTRAFGKAVGETGGLFQRMGRGIEDFMMSERQPTPRWGTGMAPAKDVNQYGVPIYG